jgi:hypothetical protein
VTVAAALGLQTVGVDVPANVYNNRKSEDGAPPKDFDRFDMAVRQIVGKRLTRDHLTGKESPTV